MFFVLKEFIRLQKCIGILNNTFVVYYVKGIKNKKIGKKYKETKLAKFTSLLILLNSSTIHQLLINMTTHIIQFFLSQK